MLCMFIVCILGLDMTDYKHSVTVTLTFDRGVKKWVLFFTIQHFQEQKYSVNVIYETLAKID